MVAFMRYVPFLLAFSLHTTSVQACELALVLAVDVSGSVNVEEYRIQMEGLGAALEDAAIAEALVVQRAQVMVLQWTGTSRQAVSVPWTQVTDFEIADRLVAQIRSTPRAWRNFSTAIGEAVSVSLAAFDAVPECKRRVIDVSGDGPSNEGVAPKDMRREAEALGVTINGLAIEATDKGLTEYYRANLITGPGSFAIRAASFQDYPARIREKLQREITKQFAALP